MIALYINITVLPFIVGVRAVIQNIINGIEGDMAFEIVRITLHIYFQD